MSQAKKAPLLLNAPTTLIVTIARHTWVLNVCYVVALVRTISDQLLAVVTGCRCGCCCSGWLNEFAVAPTRTLPDQPAAGL